MAPEDCYIVHRITIIETNQKKYLKTFATGLKVSLVKFVDMEELFSLILLYWWDLLLVYVWNNSKSPMPSENSSISKSVFVSNNFLSSSFAVSRSRFISIKHSIKHKSLNYGCLSFTIPLFLNSFSPVPPSIILYLFPHRIIVSYQNYSKRLKSANIRYVSITNQNSHRTASYNHLI